MQDLESNLNIISLQEAINGLDMKDNEPFLANKDEISLFKDLVVINHLLNLGRDSFNHKEGYQNFETLMLNSEVVEKNIRKRIPKYFLKIAAILVLFLSVGYGVYSKFNSDAIIQVSAPFGTLTEVVLPDGSTVVLNSGSFLCYRTDFVGGDVRKVSLQGEAHFQIAENKEQPFIVQLDNEVSIKVVGTTFNINSYPEAAHISTTLLTGEIHLTYSEQLKSVVMQPGQQANFTKKSKTIALTEVKDLENVIAWKSNRMVFEKQTLNTIVDQIQRTQDVTIEIRDADLKSDTYTASFEEYTSVKDVLDCLSLSGNFKYYKDSEKEWIIVKKKKTMN